MKEEAKRIERSQAGSEPHKHLVFQSSKHPLRSWNSLHCRTFNISNWSTQSYINLQLSLSDVDKIVADLTDERWSCKISCIQRRGQTWRHLGSISRFFNWLTLLMMKNWSKTSQQDNLWKRYVEMKQKAFVIFFIQKHYLFSLFQTFLWCFIHLWWCFPPIPLNVKILEQNTDCFLATFLCCPMFSPNNISHSECQPPNKNATTLCLRIFTLQTRCVNITHLKSQQIFLWTYITSTER